MSAEIVNANLDDEVLVTQVADPASSSQAMALQKNTDAKWVTGLRPEQSGPTEAELAAAREEELEAQRLAQNPWAGKGHWLSGPMNVGLFALAIILFRLSFASIPGAYSLGMTDHHLRLAPKGEDFYWQLEYPESEVPAWQLVYEMVPLDYLVLASYPVATSWFVGYLCLNFAVATQSFVMFIGVGFAVVGALAGLGDLVTLNVACVGKVPTPGVDQCFLPITLHWVLATFGTVFPIVGMMTVSYVFDDLLYRVDKKDDWWEMVPYWRRLNKWFWITASPFFVHIYHWADCFWFNKSPQHATLKAAMILQCIVWLAVLRRCYTQKPFVVHWQEPKKADKRQPKIILPTVDEALKRKHNKKNE